MNAGSDSHPGPPGGIYVGTSGYSFQDWVGTFYPEGTPRGKMFDFYVKRFPCVEINASYLETFFHEWDTVSAWSTAQIKHSSAFHSSNLNYIINLLLCLMKRFFREHPFIEKGPKFFIIPCRLI